MYARLFDRRVILDVSDGKIGLKNFIEPFFSDTYSSYNTLFLCCLIEFDINGPNIAVLGAHNFDFDTFACIFIDNLKRRLRLSHWFRRGQFVENVCC